MKLHYFQHVPFEDPANILSWASERGWEVSSTRWYESQSAPASDAFDLLVVMGGPMSVNDEREYPWLVDEKRSVELAIGSGKAVLGVCLGAQLIANVLGARVYRNAHREIGWFPVRLTEKAAAAGAFGILPPVFTAFHWHGETFDIPSRATHVASSEACANQAFLYEKSVAALQFHIESSAGSILRLLSNCRGELDGSKYVQSADEIVGAESRLPLMKEMLYGFLDTLVGRTQ
mgnify:CR=1 FL=1